LEKVQLNRPNATIGEPVIIEARASGDIKSVTSQVIGPDKNLEIPMDDFDANNIFSARWETSFWTPGDYKIQVDLKGRYGEVDSSEIPFHLNPRI